MGVPDKYDIAIIGGGIAGLYCRLQTDSDKRVAFFELIDRIGRRTETVSIIKKLLEELKNGIHQNN